MEKGFSYWVGELWATPSQAREAWLAVRRFYGCSAVDISPWEAQRSRRDDSEAYSTPTKWCDSRALTPWVAYRADLEEVIEGEGKWQRGGHPPTAPPSLPWRRGDGEALRRERADQLGRGRSISLGCISVDRAPALGVYVESVLRFTPLRRLMKDHFSNPAKRRRLDYGVSWNVT